MSDTDADRARPELVVTPAGHDLDVWRAELAVAPSVTLPTLLDVLIPGRRADRPTRLVLASAHPDDETLGAGRLAHAWSTGTGPVTGVLATLGEACVDHVMARPAGLAERRLTEWRRATSRLGFTHGRLLDLPDGQLTGRESALIDGLWAAATDHGDGHDLVLAAPWRGDPHPDHQAVGRAAARVAEQLGLPLLEYPVWMTYWSPPDALRAADQALVVLTTEPRDDVAHREATGAFVSQIEPLTPSASPVVPAAMLEHHRRQLLILAPEYARRLPS